MRASVARRTSAGFGSPASLRSRSQERALVMGGEGQSLDFDDKCNGSQDDGGEASASETNHTEKRDNRKAKSKRTHRRAMSDPFDTPELGGTTDGDLKSLSHLSEKASYDTEDEVYDENDDFGSEIVVGLPTLPRYPVSQTHDKNCWSEPPVNKFHVRGPNYLTDKKKIQSGPYLLRARGCDLFLSEHPDQCTIGE